MAKDKEENNIMLHPNGYPEGQRSIVRMLELYENISLSILKEQLNDKDYQKVFIGRSIRTRLAAAFANPRDLREVRKEIHKELMDEYGSSPLALGIGENMAYKTTQAILAQLNEAEALTKSLRRTLAARQNEELYQLGYDMAHKQGASAEDIAKGADIMDKAIKNDTKLFQLDTPDEVKISRDDIVVPDLMATVRWGDVRQGQGVDDLDETIDNVRRKALRGVIDLKQMPNGTWAMEDFGELQKPNKDVFDGEEDKSVLSE